MNKIHPICYNEKKCTKCIIEGKECDYFMNLVVNDIAFENYQRARIANERKLMPPVIGSSNESLA